MGLLLKLSSFVIRKAISNTVFKLNLAFLSESFWDWANEIWTVRSIERSQNIWFLGILTIKIIVPNQHFYALDVVNQL